MRTWRRSWVILQHIVVLINNPMHCVYISLILREASHREKLQNGVPRVLSTD